MSTDPISLRSKMDAATALPWDVTEDPDDPHGTAGIGTPTEYITSDLSKVNAEFIVVAVNAVPGLLDKFDDPDAEVQVFDLNDRITELMDELKKAQGERDSMEKKVVQVTKERDEAMGWRTTLEAGVEYVKSLIESRDGAYWPMAVEGARAWLGRVAAKSKE